MARERARRQMSFVTKAKKVSDTLNGDAKRKGV
jgi:hypothetical protein